MFKINSPTFGSDFEMGVIDNDTKEIEPVIGLLGGTKDNPIPMEDSDCLCQEDNTMAEFNIPPVSSLKKWKYHINDAMKCGNQRLSKSNKKLIAISSHIYTNEQLLDPTLRTLGCSPSNSAYSEEIAAPDGDSTNMRTCGFHVHVGFSRKDENGNIFNFNNAQMLAKYFDLFLGVPSILLDNDLARRELYGKAGDFRNKGVWVESLKRRINLFEYRSLGGNLLKSKKTIAWIYTQTQEVIKAYNNGLKLPADEIIQQVIEQNNKSLAKELMNFYKIKLP